MAMVKLRHIKAYRDRHGKLRHYVRRQGFRSVPLPGRPGTPEFMAAYNAAIEGKTARVTPRAAEGTIRQLVTDYLRSPDFLNLKATSQAQYRAILDKFTTKHGHRPVESMPRKNAQKIIGEIADTDGPAMANLTKWVLHALMNFAVRNDWRPDNPFSLITTYKGGHHRSWTDGELAAYERRWPLGTPRAARLCASPVSRSTGRRYRGAASVRHSRRGGASCPAEGRPQGQGAQGDGDTNSSGARSRD